MRCPFCHIRLPRKETCKGYRCPTHGELNRPHTAIEEQKFRSLIGAKLKSVVFLKDGDLVAFSDWPTIRYMVKSHGTWIELSKVST